jgi:SAM-dependent methyltransferase
MPTTLTSRRARARALRNLQTIALLRPPEELLGVVLAIATTPNTTTTTKTTLIEAAAARAPTVAALAAAAVDRAPPPPRALPDLPWHALPPAADPCYVLSAEAAAGPRGRKKRAQVSNFAAVLRLLVESAAASAAPPPPPARCRPRCRPLRVVDFGSGSGAVILALAALFPPEQAVFVGVDMKLEAIDRLRQRAAEAGLPHVRGVVGMAEDFCWCESEGGREGGERQATADDDGDPNTQPPHHHHAFDVALALHACGNATDVAVELAARCGAAYAVSPCCLGKLSFSVEGGSSFHPRLRTLTSTRRGGVGGTGGEKSAAAPRLPKLEDAIAAQELAEARAAEARQRRGCPHHQGRVRVRHPRSAWLREQLARLPATAGAPGDNGVDTLFKALARAADGVNHGELSSSSSSSCCRCSPCGGRGGSGGGANAAEEEEEAGALELRAARAAKAVVEMDRSAALRETAGYSTALLRLSPVVGKPEEEGEEEADAAPGARDDLLLGVPGSGDRWQRVREAMAAAAAVAATTAGR